MNPLSFLKTSDKAMDALTKGIDSAILTKEEKLEFEQKRLDTWLELQKTIATQSTPTSISRRYVAFTVLLPFSFLCLGSAIFSAFTLLAEEVMTAKLEKVADHWLEIAADNFGFAVGSVIIFYFGPHLVGKLNGMLGKKS